MIRRDGKQFAMSVGGKPLEPVKFTDEGEGGAAVQMYREFFKNIRERKPSPLNPEVALEPSKIAFGAEISIPQNRVVTNKDCPAI